MAQRALGTKLKKGTGVSAVTVGGLTSIDGLDLTAETLDTTTLDSDGGYRTFTGGFKDGGEVSVSGYFMPEEGEGQDELYAAFEAGGAEQYSIEFPPELAAKWEFSAVVVGFKTGADLEDLLSFEATLKVSGKPTLTIGA